MTEQSNEINTKRTSHLNRDHRFSRNYAGISDSKQINSDNIGRRDFKNRYETTEQDLDGYSSEDEFEKFCHHLQSNHLQNNVRNLQTHTNYLKNMRLVQRENIMGYPRSNTKNTRDIDPEYVIVKNEERGRIYKPVRYLSQTPHRKPVLKYDECLHPNLIHRKKNLLQYNKDYFGYPEITQNRPTTRRVDEDPILATTEELEKTFFENYQMDYRKKRLGKEKPDSELTGITKSKLSPGVCGKKSMKTDDQSNKYELQSSDTYVKDEFTLQQVEEQNKNIEIMNQNELKLKYRNVDFRKGDHQANEIQKNKESTSTKLHETTGQDFSEFCGKTDTSDENTILSPKSSTKSKRSTRSCESKRSKKYEDIANLQQSKCATLSEIDVGIKKFSKIHENELKSNESKPDQCRISASATISKQSYNSQELDQLQSKLLDSRLEILKSEVFTDMFKELRNYHMENMNHELKRMEFVENLPGEFKKRLNL